LSQADHGPLRRLADGVHRIVFEVVALFGDLQHELRLVACARATELNIMAVVIFASLVGIELSALLN
jgi:hypothetical protein